MNVDQVAIHDMKIVIGWVEGACERLSKHERLVRIQLKREVLGEGPDSLHVLERTLSGGTLPHLRELYFRRMRDSLSAKSEDERCRLVQRADAALLDFYRVRGRLVRESPQFCLQLQRKLEKQKSYRRDLADTIDRIENRRRQLEDAADKLRDIKKYFAASRWQGSARGLAKVIRSAAEFLDGQQEADEMKVSESGFLRGGEPIPIDPDWARREVEKFSGGGTAANDEGPGFE